MPDLLLRNKSSLAPEFVSNDEVAIDNDDAIDDALVPLDDDADYVSELQAEMENTTEKKEPPWFPSPEERQAWRNLFPMPSFRPWQEATIEGILKGWASGKRYAIVEGPTGCHAAGTQILMYDGTCKNVEEVQIGDQLMGPDSQPRVILELHRGRQEMARIIPVKGESFVVNLDHILSLQRTDDATNNKNETTPTGKPRDPRYKGANPIATISVRDWLSKSKTYKHTHKLYRTGINFPSKNDVRSIPPYILGIWLGNGTSATVESWEFTEKHGYHVSRMAADKTAPTHLIVPNPVITLFRDLNLLKNKHVPFSYLVASRHDRLELLAGLLDTDDGYFNSCFEITQKRKHLAYSIAFLARSLGFAAYLKQTRKKSQNGAWGTYFKVSISGDISEIPTRYKKAAIRRQKKSVLRTGFKVEILPEDNYFGFTVAALGEINPETNNLYLMGDFTVCHNSGKSAYALTLGRLFNTTFLATPQKMLQNQYLRDFSEYLFELKGRATYPCLRINHALWREVSPYAAHKKKKTASDYEDKIPERGLDYIYLSEWKELDKDHPWKANNCANAPCTKSKHGADMKKECRKYNICEYIRRRDRAFFTSKFTLMNFSNLLLFSLLMPEVYSKRSLLILDESHTLESFLYEFATITVGLRQLKPLQGFMDKLEDINRITLPFTMDEFVEYADSVIIPACKKYEKSAAILAKDETETETEETKVDQLTFERYDERTRVKKLAKKLQEFIDSDPTEHSHVLVPELDNTKGRDLSSDARVGLKVKPFSVAHLGPSLAFKSSSSKVLLMSATILDPITFCKSVGIPPEESFFIRVPSTFPPEHRLIIGDLSVGSMAYSHKEKTLPKMLERILELSETHGVHKGIIHTGNYENMHKFKRWVKDADRTLNKRLLFQFEGTFDEKERLIAQHTSSLEPTILCGPGFIEGIDLKDDLARFNILMKLPYMSLADPLVKRKAEEFPQWYDLQVALAIIQAIGRSVRSETDWSVIYILDLLWKFFYDKHKDRLFPPYIQKAIRWVSERYPVPFV